MRKTATLVRVCCVLACLWFPIIASGQISNIPPDSVARSAVFQINSDSQGVLFPRMTMAQMQAIDSPAQGLIVFVSDSGHRGVHIYSGSVWTPVADSAFVIANSPWQANGGVVNTSASLVLVDSLNGIHTVSGSFIAGNGVFRVDTGNVRIAGGFLRADTSNIWVRGGTLRLDSGVFIARSETLHLDSSHLFFRADTVYHLGSVVNFSGGVVRLDSSQVIWRSGTLPVDSGALFRIESGNSGVVFPRLTTVQVNSIVTPANGLTVFNVDSGMFQVYRGPLNTTPGSWVTLSSHTDDQYWTRNGSNLYNVPGTKVGIGTQTPFNKLSVVDSIATAVSIRQKTIGGNAFYNGLRVTVDSGAGFNYPAAVYGESKAGKGLVGDGIWGVDANGKTIGIEASATDNFGVAGRFTAPGGVVDIYKTLTDSGVVNLTSPALLVSVDSGQYDPNYSGKYGFAGLRYPAAEFDNKNSFGIGLSARGETGIDISGRLIGLSIETTGAGSKGIVVTSPTNSTSLVTNGNVFLGSGLFGAGVPTQQEKLEINGALTVADASYTIPGTIQFNSTNNDFEGYDGSTWKSMTGGSAGSPWTTSGNHIHNSNSGNVGVGTSTPITGLQVAGGKNVLFGNDSVTTGGFYYQSNKQSLRVGVLNPGSTAWRDSVIGDASFSAGTDNRTPGTNSVATGLNNKAYGYQSFATGVNNRVSALNAAAIGGGNRIDSNADYTLAAGEGNYIYSTQGRNVALGDYNAISGHHAVAIGGRNGVFDNYSTAIGQDDTVTGFNAVGIGTLTKVTATYAQAIGYKARTDADFALALGNQAYVGTSGTYAVAIGSTSEANGVEAVAIGTSHALAANAFAAGKGNYATGTASVAIGEGSISNGVNATSIGRANVANGNFSSSLGYATHTNAYASTALGTFNDTTGAGSTTQFNPADHLLTIGNGSLQGRSNAMTMLKNGRTGFGTNLPQARVDVAGPIRVANSTGYADTAGLIRYNAGTFEGYTGTAWTPFNAQTLTLAGSTLSISGGNSVTLPGGGGGQWNSANTDDIQNGNTGRVLVGSTITRPAGPSFGGRLLVRDTISGGAAIRAWTNAAYESAIVAHDSGSSGNPRGCVGCVGQEGLNAYSRYGDAIFANSATRGIYLKGGSAFYPAMVIDTNGSAATALQLNGPLQLNYGAPAAGKVLTSDASGNASWQPAQAYAAGSGIDITGNVITAYDNSPTNEIQNLTLSGNTLFISGGNSVTLPSGGQWSSISNGIRNASGNQVAVNTSSPRTGFALDVRDSVGTSKIASFLSSNTYSTVDFGASNAARGYISASGLSNFVALGSYNNGDVAIETGGQAKLTVNGTTGYTMIGNGSATQQLEVAGGIRIDYTNIGLNGSMRYDGTTGKFQGYHNGWIDLNGVSGSGGSWLQNGANIYNSNNGKVGIGTATPQAKLHVADSSVLFTASNLDASAPTPVAGAGIRTMWFPQRAAFRTGRVLCATCWDQSNIGNYSFAAGLDTKASGQSSTAIGEGAFATGSQSFAAGYNSLAANTTATAFGNTTKALGYSSFAAGELNKAIGTASFSMGTQDSAIGDNSVALGNNTVASGNASFTTGYYAVASGDNASASGDHTQASGPASFAIGGYNEASGLYAMATGYNSKAQGLAAVTIGNGTTASGQASFAAGINCTAVGDESFSAGFENEANGLSSAAMGWHTRSVGISSMATGLGNTAFSAYSFVTGIFADSLAGSDANSNIATDPLFIIGNGSAFVRHNAITLLKNGNLGLNTDSAQQTLDVNGGMRLGNTNNALAGSLRFNGTDFEGYDGSSWKSFASNSGNSWNVSGANISNSNGGKVGIGTSTPLAKLHVKDSSVLFEGPSTLPYVADQPPVSTSGNRAMWYADKAAFLTGGLSYGNSSWDADSIGQYSFNAGLNNRSLGTGSAVFGINNHTTADANFAAGKDNVLETGSFYAGVGATALGLGNNVAGQGSFAAGEGNKATRDQSIAIGQYNQAKGYQGAIAIGSNTKSVGGFTVAMGYDAKAKSYASISLGVNSDTLASATEGYWVPTDPLLTVGNGLSAPHNALNLLKNGNLGVNTDSANSLMHVRGSFATAITTQSSSYTAGIDDYTIIMDASAAASTLALPSAAGIAGRIYTIKKKDNSANAVTIAASGSETIDGASTQSLSTQWKYITVQSDGSDWMIIANN